MNIVIYYSMNIMLNLKKKCLKNYLIIKIKNEIYKLEYKKIISKIFEIYLLEN